MNTQHLTDDVLYGFDDGTLAAAERQDAARHLRGCAQCRGRLESTHGVKQTLHTQLRQARAPSTLRATLRGRLATQTAAPGVGALGGFWPRAATLGMGALVLVAALLAIARGYGQTPSLLAELAHAHASLASEAPALQVRGDNAAVSGWFGSKLGRPSDVPDIEGLQLQGGRLDQIEGADAMHLVYQQANGAPMSLLVWSGTAPLSEFTAQPYEGGSFYVGTQGAETVVVWPVRDVRYACVSAAPAEVVLDMAGKLRRELAN